MTCDPEAYLHSGGDAEDRTLSVKNVGEDCASRLYIEKLTALWVNSYPVECCEVLPGRNAIALNV